MDSGLSLYNPGSTINFNVENILSQNNEEEEAAEDERQKQKELEDLLSTAFDDLIEDEDGSELVDDSQFEKSVQNFERKDNWILNEQIKNHSDTEQSFNYWLHHEQDKISRYEEDNNRHEKSNISCHLSEEFDQNGILSRKENQNDISGNQISHKFLEFENPNFLTEQTENIKQNYLENSSAQLLLCGTRNDSMEMECIPPIYSEEIKTENNISKEIGNDDDDQMKKISNNNDNEKLQFEILYNARGREIKRLNNELNQIKEEKFEEIKILKHQLTLAQGDFEEIAFSLKQAQEILAMKEEENSSLKGQITALEFQLNSEKVAKEEIISKLHVTEATISSLQKQISELSQSENLVRSKEQYESIIRNIKKNHQEEILLLQTEIDKFKHELNEKKEENEILQKDLSNQAQLLQECKLEKVETINRLTKSLEASQRQCQELLESGTLQEASYLKGQFKHLEISKSEAENYIKELEAEIKSLKSEVENYENIWKLGIFENTKITEMNDSIEQLGLRKQDRCQNIDDITIALKSELQKSLLNLRSRRNQLGILQLQLASTERELAKQKKEKEIYEEKIKSAEVRASQLEKQHEEFKISTDKIFLLEKEVSDLKNKSVSLNKLLEEKNKEIENLYKSKQKLEDIIKQMNEEMKEKIKQKETEKYLEVEKCREVCLQLHQDSREKLRNEILTGVQVDYEFICKEYEEKIKLLEDEIRQLTGSMDEVKELYIKLCDEKNQLENQIQKLNEERNSARTEVESKLFHQFQEEQKHFKIQLEKQYEEKIIKEKNELMMAITKQIQNQYEEEKQQLLEKIKFERSQNMENIVQKIKNDCFQELIELSEKGDHLSGKTAIVDLYNKIIKHYKDDKQKSLEELHQQIEKQYKEKIISIEKAYLEKIEKLRQNYVCEIEEAISKTKEIYCKQKDEALKHHETEIEHLKQEIVSLEEQLETLKKFIPMFVENEQYNKMHALENSIHQEFCKSQGFADKEETKSKISNLTTEIETSKNERFQDNRKLKEKLKKCQKYIMLANKKHKEEIGKLTNEFHSIIDKLKTKISALQEEELKKTEERIINLKEQHKKDLLEIKNSMKNSIEKQNVYTQTFERCISLDLVNMWKENIVTDLRKLSEKMNSSLVATEEFSKRSLKQALFIYHSKLVQDIPDLIPIINIEPIQEVNSISAIASKKQEMSQNSQNKISIIDSNLEKKCLISNREDRMQLQNIVLTSDIFSKQLENSTYRQVLSSTRSSTSKSNSASLSSSSIAQKLPIRTEFSFSPQPISEFFTQLTPIVNTNNCTEEISMKPEKESAF